jgi:hypothetical protein
LTQIINNKIRQIQIQYTIKRKNRLPSNCDVPGDASMVLQNLSEVLIIAYPLILIVLFWLPVLREEVLNRLVLLSRLLILLKR